MGRPRLAFYGETVLVPFRHRWGADVLPGKVGTRASRRYDASQNWVYPQANGVADPLTYLFVLEALVNAHPDVQVTAKGLVTYLGGMYPQFVWDSVTVGRVVSDLRDNLEDVNGPGNAFLEGKKGRKGNFFFIHRTPEAMETALGLLADLYRLTELEMAARRQGKKTFYPFGPLPECPTVVVER